MSARILLAAMAMAGLSATAAIAGQPANPGGFGHDAIAVVAHSAPGLVGAFRSDAGGAQAPFGGNPTANSDVKASPFCVCTPTHGKP
jgi:hypothetical protein